MTLKKKYRIAERSDSMSEWDKAGLVLAEGEIANIRGTDSYKKGDGVTPWSELPTFYRRKKSEEEEEEDKRATEDRKAVYNLDAEKPLVGDTYSSSSARKAVPVSVRKKGLIICYKTSSGTVTEQFVGSDTSSWETADDWLKFADDAKLSELVLKNQIGIHFGQNVNFDSKELVVTVQSGEHWILTTGDKKMTNFTLSADLKLGIKNNGIQILWITYDSKELYITDYSMSDLKPKSLFIASWWEKDNSFIHFSSNVTIDGCKTDNLFLKHYLEETVKSNREIFRGIQINSVKSKMYLEDYYPNLWNSGIALPENNGLCSMCIPIQKNEVYVSNTNQTEAKLYRKSRIENILKDAHNRFIIPNYDDLLYIKVYVESKFNDICYFVRDSKKKYLSSYTEYLPKNLNDLLYCKNGNIGDLIAEIEIYKVSFKPLLVKVLNKKNNLLTFGIYENGETQKEYMSITVNTAEKESLEFRTNDYYLKLNKNVLASIPTEYSESGNYNLINPNRVKKNDFKIVKKGSCIILDNYIIQDRKGFQYQEGGQCYIIPVNKDIKTENDFVQITWSNLLYGSNPSAEYKYYAFFRSLDLHNSGFLLSKELDIDKKGILHSEIPSEANYFVACVSWKIASPDAKVVDTTRVFLQNETLYKVNDSFYPDLTFVNEQNNNKNLLDVNNYYPLAVYKDGVFLRESSSGSQTSIFYVDGSKKELTISGFKTDTKNDWRCFALYDKHGNVLIKDYLAQGIDVPAGVTVNVPSRTINISGGYMLAITTIFDKHRQDLATAQVEYGHVATSYKEYVSEPIQLKAGNKVEGTFKDVIWDVIGDSKTAETYDKVINWSYYVQSKLGIGVRNNYAQAGAHWEDFQTDTPRQKFSQQVIDCIAAHKESGSRPNIITMSLGTNSLNAPVGNFEEIINIPWGVDGSSIERNTVLGGMRWGIETLKREYPDAVFLAATPLPRAGSANNKIPAMISNMKKMLDAYGIPLLDLYLNAQYAPVIDNTIIKADPRTEGNWWHYDGLHDSVGGARMTAKVWGNFMFGYLNMIAE